MITFNKLGQYGRFGNQLFHIASTIGIATKHGYSWGFPEWKEREHFVHKLPLFTEKLPEYKLKSDKGLLIEYIEFKLADNISILGHMFSEEYFKHCDKLIKWLFEMKEIKALPEIPENSVAVHFRGGDFGSKQFPRLEFEYYERALLNLACRGHFKFYIFTDDIKAAKKIFDSGFNYIETNNYIHDFYLMQKCKHFIIANSTYSWWAAYLGKHKDKIVIAPKNDPGAMYTDEMYPKEWVVI